MDGNSYEECGKFGYSHALSSTFEKSMSTRKTCCATYVSWVLQEAGYITEAEHTNSANTMTALLKSKGWIVLSPSEAQPGDVLSYNHHVEIYAGNGTVYNAGSGDSIRGASPHQKNISGATVLRAPNNENEDNNEEE